MRWWPLGAPCAVIARGRRRRGNPAGLLRFARNDECCAAHSHGGAVVQTLAALLAARRTGDAPMSDPGLDFNLGEMADTIRETTRRFAKDKIEPIAAEIDETDKFPRQLWPQMGELGLHGITVEEEDGGLGLGYLEHVVAQEEVARASGSVGLSYGAHSNLCVNQIRRWANSEQKKQYLPKLISGEHVGALAMSEAGAGSDVVGMKLRAEPAGK